MRWNNEVFGRKNLEVEDKKDQIEEIGDLLFNCKESEVVELINRRSHAFKRVVVESSYQRKPTNPKIEIEVD